MSARVFVAGEKLPMSLSREELAGIVGLSLHRFDEVRALQTHPAIKELLPRCGRPRFSGTTAQAWVDQQPEQPVEATRKFFAGARR